MKTVTQILFTILTALLVLAGCAGKQPSPNLCPTVCDGLVAYYPFYGDATDKSGNGHDGKVLGATLTKDRNGYPNHAYELDGDYSQIKLSIKSNIEEDSFTLVVILKPKSIPDSPNRRYGIVWKGGSGVGAGIGMHPVGTGGFYFDPSSNKEDSHHFNANGRYNKKIETYYHVVGVADRLKHVSIIYVNGESEGYHNWPNGDKLSLNSDWSIGNEPLNLKHGFNGVIDEVRVYNRALSADEVKELYLFTSAFPPVE
jgi:hypothetical protein